MLSTPPIPKPAATLILFREAAGENFEIFLMKRAQQHRSFAKAHVFPGGKMEDVDREYAKKYPADFFWPDFALAAIRETAEEIGVFLVEYAEGSEPDSAKCATLRKGLRAGDDFYDLIEKGGAVPSLAKLFPFSWWITPEIEPRRYDTRFFLAKMPPQKIHLDPSEASEGGWFTPSRALKAYDNGEIFLMPPTVISLDILASMKNFKDACRLADYHAPICPTVIQDEQQNLKLKIPNISSGRAFILPR